MYIFTKIIHFENNTTITSLTDTLSRNVYRNLQIEKTTEFHSIHDIEIELKMV